MLESVNIDDDLIEEIEEAYLAVVRAEAAVASVETTASQDLAMEIDGERVVLGAGETQRTVVTEEVSLVVPTWRRSAYEPEPAPTASPPSGATLTRNCVACARRQE